MPCEYRDADCAPSAGELSSLVVLLRRVQLLVVCAMFFPLVVAAQGNGPSEFRVGIGTFLSHDRGWNYDEAIEVFAAFARHTSSIDLETGASFSKSFVQFSQPAVSPPPANPYRDGFRARFGVRLPSKTRSAVSALIGAELVHNRTKPDARATTIAGSAGLSFYFGPERRGMLDLRYVRFAKRLGTSRGILPLNVAWQL